jgi:transcriptional regulator with XRE-family HTH domain
MTGDELREKRTTINLTQAQLADVLGVKSNTVARWERGLILVPQSIELAMEEVVRKYKPKKKAANESTERQVKNK